MYFQHILKGNSGQKRDINNETGILMCVKNYFLANVAILSLHIDADTDLEEYALFLFRINILMIVHIKIFIWALLFWGGFLGFIFSEKAK